MLVFQLFVYPRVVERIGPTLSQRWSCFVTIPVYLSYPPLLSMLHDSGEVLVIASVAVLFFISIAANAVSATPNSIRSFSCMLVLLDDVGVRCRPWFYVTERAEHLGSAVRCFC